MATVGLPVAIACPALDTAFWGAPSIPREARACRGSHALLGLCQRWQGTQAGFPPGWLIASMTVEFAKGISLPLGTYTAPVAYPIGPGVSACSDGYALRYVCHAATGT